MKKNVLPLILVLLCSINIFALLDSAEVSVPLEMYDNGGGQKTLYFGVDPTATDSIDFNLGELDLPPFPPAGVFDTRWILPINNLSSWKDYRFGGGVPFADTIIYRLKFQSAAGADTLFFAWNFPSGITAKLEDLATGQFINVNMAGSGLYGMSEFNVFNQLKFTVYYNILPTDVKTNIVPEDYTLFQNYPNPFNPATTIKFSLPEAANVTLTIYNTLGQKVTELVNTELEAGNYSYQWDAGNVATGMYIYELRTDKFVSVKKMVLMK